MIPVSLKLKGIYSYQEEQHIDFTNLTEAHIFGIFGAVGSGKSAILEAITFAMYGETERLDKRDNRTYNMMNLKSDDLYIEFVFRSGEKDNEYMFTVTGSRNGKHFEKVGTFKRAAYIRKGKKLKPLDSANAEEIIGLSYENFKRTIIIPQGKFQEFLQLGDADRTRMMKELFHLGRFDLSFKVSSLEAGNNSRITRLEGQLSQLSEVSPELVAEKEKGLAALREEIKKIQDELAVKEKAAAGLAQLKELGTKKLEQEKRLHELLQKEAGYTGREKALDSYEFCHINFHSLLGSVKEMAARTQQVQAELTKHKADAGKIASQLETEERTFAAVKKEYLERESLKRRAEELAKVEQLLKVERELAELGQRIEKGHAYFDTASKEASALQQHRVILSEQIKMLKKQLPDTRKLSEAKEWFTLEESLAGVFNETKESIGVLQKNISAVSLQSGAALKPEIKKLLPAKKKELTQDELIAAVEEARKKINDELDQLAQQTEHLKLQDKLKAYAETIKEGDPCPLCGATDHPQVLDVKDVSKGLKQAALKRSELNNLLMEVDETLRAIGESRTEQKTYEKELTKALAKLKKDEEKLNKHRELFVWPEFLKTGAKEVANALTAAEKQKKQVEKLDEELEKVQKQGDEKEKLKENARALLDALQKDEAGKKAAHEGLLKQLVTVDAAAYRNAAPAALKKEMQALMDRYELLADQHEKLEAKINALKQQVNTLKGNIESGEKNLLELEQRLSETNGKIAEKLAASPYANIEAVKEVLAREVDMQAERRVISTYREELKAAQEFLKQTEQQLEGKVYNAEVHNAITALVEEMKKKLQERTVESGKQQQELGKLKQDMDAAVNFTKELEKLKLRASNLSVLKNMFRGSGFVNYVSSVYLQQLCNAANERFHRLTRQKLKLELTEGNNFQVRDYLNNGQVRSVKTLSGGQTFQAALSLALALADNIQELTRSKQNFFFLDEGFGSLDKDNLQIVFDTLKTLRKENRIVGVISHVEELQQEIDAHLMITNEEELGSVVRGSWDG